MTGLRHLDATVSMARGDSPSSAGGNFVLTVGPTPQMDARPGYPGYAAFGRVVGGMDLVKRILALPSGGGMDAMKGQMILRPVRHPPRGAARRPAEADRAAQGLAAVLARALKTLLGGA